MRKGDCDNMLGQDRLYLRPARAVVIEPLRGRAALPRDAILHEVRAKRAPQMAFVEHDDEIEAFAANRADDALGEAIVPGRERCDDIWRMAMRSTRRWKSTR
jgi:hypothetical protein